MSERKYTDKQIEDVILLREHNVPFAVISQVTGVHKQTCNTIILRKARHLVDEEVDGFITMKHYMSKYGFNTAGAVLYYIETGRLKGIKKSKLWFLEDKEPRDRRK